MRDVRDNMQLARWTSMGVSGDLTTPRSAASVYAAPTPLRCARTKIWSSWLMELQFLACFWVHRRVGCGVTCK